ncbi:hypothetical protein N7510_009341 [Penicillium lagena]|uniref:uncharacterized protein n=1 Tax=Penicillium lagena TaxID=94218 RepID=UPI0025413C5C|nr:uncharacterized protein N7510_009341 [Penicillium lagena]KAJ5606560.1 hypothetical protein N7510_009341 [Penicillium lagena]
MATPTEICSFASPIGLNRHHLDNHTTTRRVSSTPALTLDHRLSPRLPKICRSDYFIALNVNQMVPSLRLHAGIAAVTRTIRMRSKPSGDGRPPPGAFGIESRDANGFE